MSKEIDFGDLYNKSTQIVNRISSFTSPIGLSSFNIERNLQDIGDTSKQLNELTSSKIPFSNPLESNVFQDSKINRKYGLDPKLLAKNLSNINTASFTDVETIPTDIDGYLKIQFENIILNTIGDIQKKTSKEFQTHYEQTSIHDWNKDKKYLEEVLGQKYIKATPSSFSTSQQSSMLRSTTTPYGMGQQSIRGGFGQQSQIGYGSGIGGGYGQQSQIFRNSQSMIGGNINSINAYSQQRMAGGGLSEDRTKLSNKMKKYANIIEEYDIHLADQSKTYGFPLINRLMDASLSCDNTTTTSTTIVSDHWSLLLKLTGEIDTSKGSSSQHQQQKSHERPTSIELVKRSISFLEQQFSHVIERRLPKHSNVSLPLNIIVAYIKSLNQSSSVDSSDEIYEDCSIWCIVYYLLRCGYTKEAQDFALDKCGSRYIDILSPIFKNITSTGNNVVISKEQKDRMTREFNTAKTESKDAFKISVFNLLSCNDANSTKQQAVTTVQDYIWWKLCFIRDKSIGQIELNNSSLSLLEVLQNEIKQLIEKNKNHFENLEIFQLLLSTLQFEDAVASLYQTSPEDSLHLAIALDYYKLLKTSNQPVSTSPIGISSLNSSTASTTPYQQHQQQIQLSILQQQQEIYDSTSKSIRLVSMIKQYTKLFSFEESKEALFYYLLITDDQIKIREISELVVSSTNGYKFAQELSMFSAFITKQQWRTIIEQSALELENKNDYQGAIEFWLMIEEYPRVLEIYNSRISVLLTSISSERDQLYQFGKQLFNDRQGRLKTTTTARTSYLAFEQLLKLCDFFDFYNKEKYQEALQKIENLDILPIHESEIDAKVQDYRFLSPHITRNFSSIIQAYVDIIVKQYNLLSLDNQAAGGIPNNNALFAGRKQTIQDLQSRTQCIALFAGKIDFPMSGNILPRLMNLYVQQSHY